MEVEPKGIIYTARLCHEVVRAMSHAAGDESHLHWDDMPLELQNSAIKGVEVYLASDCTMNAEAQHDAWVADKIAGGWVYGLTTDRAMKVHASLRPYGELSPLERLKDTIFQTVVKTIWIDIVKDEAVLKQELSALAS